MFSSIPRGTPQRRHPRNSEGGLPADGVIVMNGRPRCFPSHYALRRNKQKTVMCNSASQIASRLNSAGLNCTKKGWSKTASRDLSQPEEAVI
jgi:hypothetical protein